MQDKIMMIPLGELEPHDMALRFWAENEVRKEDVEAVYASVKSMRGVIQPLHVTPKRQGTGYWVIDGCTRLEGCRRAGLSEVSCLVSHIDDADIQDAIYVSNVTRSRFGTGLRVMRYLEIHMNAVLMAARENADASACGAKGGRGNKAGTCETRFTSEAISERLGVGKEDVLRGVELLRCKYDGLIPDLSVAKKRTLLPVTSEVQRELIEEMYRRVTSGETPIRKWAAACGSKAKTEGKARAPANYAVIGPDCLVTLKNTFSAWQTLAYMDRERILERLNDALDAAPEDVTTLLRKLYGQQAKKSK